MARGISIHIGVNRPATAAGPPLTLSEKIAFKMAEVAHDAGYNSIHVLRGPEATRRAVINLLARATRALEPGQTLFVSYSGHGSQIPDESGDEADHLDETWCLHDADLVDDELVRIWGLAPAGARIVLVVESCFGGGMYRADHGVLALFEEGWSRPASPPYRSAQPVMRGVQQYQPDSGSCISGPARENDGIRATMLVMMATAETRKAREGLYTGHLLKLWRRGAFRDSFCALHERLCVNVTRDLDSQQPQITMRGTYDERMPLQTAFHLNPPVTRGGWQG